LHFFVNSLSQPRDIGAFGWTCAEGIDLHAGEYVGDLIWVEFGKNEEFMNSMSLRKGQEEREEP